MNLFKALSDISDFFIYFFSLLSTFSFLPDVRRFRPYELLSKWYAFWLLVTEEQNIQYKNYLFQFYDLKKY